MREVTAIPQLDALLEEVSRALLRARPRRSGSPAFPSGYAALALAHHHLERALPGRGHAERAGADLARAARALGSGTQLPILFGGFTGLAWVATHLAPGDDGDPEHAPDGDPCADIDDALLDYLDVPRWHATYDLIGGLVGYGVYALERLPRPAATAMLERIVAHLAALSERQSPGIAWRTRPAWWPPNERTPARRGWNLGVAHGVPGVIALLARVWRAGIAQRDSARLLDGAVAWLLAQERPRASPSCFGWMVRRGEVDEPARSAWCYGDPGIAAALLVAARASGEPAWKRAAVRIGLRAAERDPQGSGVVDAGLCHGASGLAHVFHRLAVDTGNARFTRAARAWLARTLAMCTSGAAGGFRGWQADPGKPVRVRWTSDVSFLGGSAGIALALAAFRTPLANGWAAWDRILLVSDAPPAK